MNILPDNQNHDNHSEHLQILLVEDDKVDFMMAERLLKQAYGSAFDLYWSDTSDQALLELDNTDIDICLIDYQLGHTNGIELLALMNKAGHEAVPKILLTGMNSYEVDHKATEAGATDYLVKDQLGSELLERSIRYSIKQKKIEQHMSFMALHDSLTGLANRVLLEEHLTRTISSTARHREYSALLFIDLDHFKSVNDSLGHGIGDHLLIETARRLQNQVRNEDIVSRFGGDEFVLLLPRLGRDKKEACNNVALMADKIRQMIGKPAIVDNTELRISASIGASMFCNDNQDSGSILKQADIAMYRSKSDGRDTISIFESSMEDLVQSSYWVSQELQCAIDEHQLYLNYQPIVALSNGETVGAEALIRWQHPLKGNIPPDEFIPKAEESELICSIGKIVMVKACQFLYDNPELGYLSINIGKRHFEDRTFIDDLTAVITETGIAPERLVIEITENLFLKNPQAAIEKMRRIKSSGIKFAMDDFGTGYSSLSMLKDLPIDILKIDRSFTRCIGEDPSAEAIVIAIINMSHALGLTVIAEGVELVEQANFMRNYNCSSAQGYYFSKPLSCDDIGASLMPVKPVIP